MNLQRLEINGFKSFNQRTVVDFNRGITAIVGPNGCGKSNIVDALKWVLGEQSAKSLRGTRMDDVIFAGTRRHTPMDFCKVSLVFSKTRENEPHVIDRVEIGRKITRDGKAQYVLNGKPVRLRDLQEITMDTGAGTKAYSFMEQGQLDALLMARPEERRLLIEEAAGVMKYKLKRKKAEQKLQEAQDNLLRISDIYEEVKRERAKLQRQANKAVKYKQLLEELKELELALFCRIYRQMSAEQEELTETRDNFHNIKTHSQHRLAELEELLQEANKAHRSVQDRLKDAKDEKSHNSLELTRLDKEDEMIRQRLDDDHHFLGQAEKELESLDVQQEKLISDLSSQKNTNQDLYEDYYEQEKTVIDLQDTLKVKQKAFRECERELEKKRTRGIELLTQFANTKNEYGKMESNLKNLDVQMRRLKRDRYENDGEIKAKEEQVSHYQDGLQQAKDGLSGIINAKTALEAEIDGCQVHKSELKKETQRLHKEVTQLEARKKSLEELTKSLEGFADGPKALMKQYNTDSDGQKVEKLILANIFQTEKEYELALESVLGDRFQAVILDDHQRAGEALEFLKSSNIGRAAVIPRRLKGKSSDLGTLTEQAGVVGQAMNLVQVEQEYYPLLQALLNDVVVVESYETAVHLWQQNGHKATLVTLDGDILYPEGVVNGGSPKKSVIGYLSKRREIKELQTRIEETTQKQTETETALENLQIQIKEKKAELTELSAQEQQANIKIAHREKDVERATSEYRKLKSIQEMIELGIKQNETERESLNKQLQDITDHLENLERERFEVEKLTNELATSLKELSETCNELNAKLSDARIKLSTLREQKTNTEKAIQSINKRIEEIKQQYSSVKDRQKLTSLRIVEGKKQLDQNQTRRKELRERQIVLEKVISKLEDGLDDSIYRLQKLSRERKDLQIRLEKLNDNLSESSLKLSEISIRLEQEVNRIMDKYQVRYEDIAEQYDSKQIVEDVSKRHIQDLKSKLQRLGEVNLEALEDFKTADERFQFLTSQREDLYQSIDTLKATIKRLDKKSHELLKETFDSVNRHFNQIIKRLFQGGSGKLKLTDEQDLLNSGVDITVHPPGKRLQKISLLSGGEKALVNLSFLVALFLHKPSPFCIMDEVDAPLDEANIYRFIELIRELSQHTQIIIVTHNQRTMEMADILYGVTMEDQGVSKIVSAKLDVA